MSLTRYLYAFVLYLVDTGICGGNSLIKLSSDSVYNGELVTVMCRRSAGVLLSLTVDAFNATHQKGSLCCTIDPVATTGTGVFYGYNFTGCPLVLPGSTIASVSLVATPSLELNYNCTSVIYNTTARGEFTQRSDAVSLSVLVLPAKPIFTQSRLVFNMKDNATVACESRNGKPAALLRLTVRTPNGKEVAATGNDSTLVMLPLPLTDWHNAQAVCSVMNHNFSNNTVSSTVTIYHIFTTSDRVSVYWNSSNATLDCSAYISSYPDPQYSWAFSQDVSAVYHSIDSDPLLTVLQGEPGPFYCTATNDAINSSVVVVFTAYIHRQQSSVLLYIGFCFFVIAMFIVLVILGRRRYVSTRFNQGCLKLLTLLRHETAPDNGEDISMTDNVVYSCVPAPVADVNEDAGPSCYQLPTRCEGISDGDDKQYPGDRVAEQERYHSAHIYEEIGAKADRLESQNLENDDTKLLSTATDVT